MFQALQAEELDHPADSTFGSELLAERQDADFAAQAGFELPKSLLTVVSQLFQELSGSENGYRVAFHRPT